MLRHVRLHPVGEIRVRKDRLVEFGALVRQLFVSGRLEIGLDARDLFWREMQCAAPLDFGEFRLHLTLHFLDADLVDKDLDACLVDVVAAPIHVVDAQDRLEIGEQVFLRHEVGNLLGDHRRAAETAPDIDFIADFALAVLDDLDTDIVYADRGAIVRRTGDGDLELARQVGKFRVEGRPLPDDLRDDTRIFKLAFCGARILVRGHVADAVARGLDAMHLDRGEILQNIRHVLQRRPVELEVLARREVAIAAVIFAAHMGKHAQLP